MKLITLVGCAVILFVTTHTTAAGQCPRDLDSERTGLLHGTACSVDQRLQASANGGQIRIEQRLPTGEVRFLRTIAVVAEERNNPKALFFSAGTAGSPTLTGTAGSPTLIGIVYHHDPGRSSIYLYEAATGRLVKTMTVGEFVHTARFGEDDKTVLVKPKNSHAFKTIPVV
jgi:hypothetical protein